LLKNGYSVGEVSARLGSMFQCDGADIRPFLKALFRARMIRSIDGRPVGTDATSLKRQVQQRLEWIRIRARAVVTRAFIRSLPIAITHRAMCLLRPGWTRAKKAEARAQVQQNLISVFGGSLSLKRIQSLAHEFVAEQVRREVDLELLTELPEIRVGKWLRRCCDFEGLEHLENAVAVGKGVLLTCFHFSSAHLIVLLLWLRGYSFTGAGGMSRKNRDRLLPFDNPQLAWQLNVCGKVKWYTTMTLESALNICRTVNQGGIGLVFPDGFTTRSKGELATYFGHDAAQYRRAHCEAPFLGRTAQANTGVPWIYKQSNALLIPVKVVRDSFHCFRIIVGPELKLDREAPLEKVTADLYRRLESEVTLDPAAWAYWRIMDQFTTAS
jgi:lauroyl/myristoyl acyltransferase